MFLFTLSFFLPHPYTESSHPVSHHHQDINDAEDVKIWSLSSTKCESQTGSTTATGFSIIFSLSYTCGSNGTSTNSTVILLLLWGRVSFLFHSSLHTLMCRVHTHAGRCTHKTPQMDEIISRPVGERALLSPWLRTNSISLFFSVMLCFIPFSPLLNGCLFLIPLCSLSSVAATEEWKEMSLTTDRHTIVYTADDVYERWGSRDDDDEGRARDQHFFIAFLPSKLCVRLTLSHTVDVCLCPWCTVIPLSPLLFLVLLSCCLGKEGNDKSILSSSYFRFLLPPNCLSACLPLCLLMRLWGLAHFSLLILRFSSYPSSEFFLSLSSVLFLLPSIHNNWYKQLGDRELKRDEKTHLEDTDRKALQFCIRFISLFVQWFAVWISNDCMHSFDVLSSSYWIRSGNVPESRETEVPSVCKRDEDTTSWCHPSTGSWNDL